MNKKQKNDTKMQTKVFETLAITEAERKTRNSRAAIPSEFNVKEAKDWVDHNKK